MQIAVAQIHPIAGDLAANIEVHRWFIYLAIRHKSGAIFFPELSLTGYEPELAKDLATHQADPRFNDFRAISDNHNITIGLGMPVKTISGIQISMLIYQPCTALQVYTKQLLHANELPYFIKGDKQIILTIGNINIAPAICYESLQTEHAASANKLGAQMYVASVAKSEQGVSKALAHYPAMAKKFAMPILMANCVGHCDNFKSAGNSSVWNKQGNLLGQLNNK